MEPISTERRQQMLINVARDLSRTENVEQLLDQILECSREVMDCEVCSILLPEFGTGDLLIRSTNDEPDQEAIRVPKGKGIAGYVYENKVPVNLEDAKSDPRHFGQVGSEIGLVTRNMLTIPLLDGERCLGAMQAINSKHREKFAGSDEEIFETFGALIAVTLMRLESQQRSIKEAEVRQQLELAHEIQASFLPPIEANIGNINLSALYEPAAETGGDFFFWHELEDNKVLLGIGDVCGKGFPAALDMARGTTLITSIAHRASRFPLDEWVTEVNSRLCDVMSNGRFIACAFLLIDLKKRIVSVCLCGALPPKVLLGDHWEDVPIAPNPPLGISCALSYKAETFSLSASRSWMVLSDGILETQNEKGEYFEEGPFDEVMAQIAATNDPDILGTLTGAWKEFSKTAIYQDDTTVLLFEDQFPRPAAQFEFTCSPDSISKGREFVEEWAKFCGMDEETTGMVVLGCDELLTNVSKHAYCETGIGPVIIHASAELNGLEFRIEHSGSGIANDELPEVKEKTEPTVGKMGMGVIHTIFDEVDYQKSDSASSVTVTKRVER